VKVVYGTLLLIALLASGSGGGAAQMTQVTPNVWSLPTDGERPKAEIGDVAWIAGSWEGEAFGGSAEETWSSPRAGTMIGMFRIIKDGRPGFYEILCISEDGGSLVLKLKHFNADLTGWEEKDETVTFPLVKLGVNEAYFDGMTFRRVGDELQVFVASKAEDGTASELAFRYTRQSSP
jgi:hypothetical protein